MSKQDFLTELRKGLSGLPRDEIEERLTFYSEMILYRMEEGLSEEDAISEIGSVDEIVTQAVADIPLAKIAKERIKPKRHLKARGRSIGAGFSDMVGVGNLRCRCNFCALRFTVGCDPCPVGGIAAFTVCAVVV